MTFADALVISVLASTSSCSRTIIESCTVSSGLPNLLNVLIISSIICESVFISEYLYPLLSGFLGMDVCLRRLLLEG